MSAKEVRCYQCDKLLGTADTEFLPIIFPMAVSTEPGQLVFTIKCPRCGKFNHIKFK